MSFAYIPLEGGALPSLPRLKHRVLVRYRCAPATPGRLVQPEKGEVHRAWVLNLSLGGIVLLLARSFEPGTELIVHLKSATSKTRYELPAQVMHSTQQPAQVMHSTQQPGGDWLVGCEFARKLSEDELEDLL
jgi:hypothetical protein